MSDAPPIDTCTPNGGACAPLDNPGMPLADSPPEPACYDVFVCSSLWHPYGRYGYYTPQLCCFSRDAGAD